MHAYACKSHTVPVTGTIIVTLWLVSDLSVKMPCVVQWEWSYWSMLSVFHTLFKFSLPICSSIYPHPNTSLLLFSHILALTTFLTKSFFFPSPLFRSPPCRGAGVVGAVSLLGPGAAGSGQGTLRAGFRPGRPPPVRSPLRPSPRAHPAPASPGGAGPRDAKVRKPNTPLSSASVLLKEPVLTVKIHTAGWCD